MPSGVWKRTKKYKDKMKLVKRRWSPENREKMRKLSASRCGDKASGWKGGRSIHEGGYILILQPNHPYRNAYNYVREHRLIMEAHIGRILLLTEIVHHINGIVNDNRIENLMLFSSKSEHAKFHYKPQHVKNGRFTKIKKEEENELYT